MLKPIRILILIDHLGTGGAQEFVYQLARHLASDRVQLSVATLRSGGIDRSKAIDPGIYREKLEQLGIAVHTLAPNPRLSQFPSALYYLLRLLCTQRYDVVNTILQASFVCGSPLAWLLRIPTVHSVMSVRAQNQRWYFPLMSWYQGLVNLYITPIPKELTDAGVGEQRVKLIEVTADFTEMLAVRHDPQQVIVPFELMSAYPVALSIGRLHPDKGHEYAIQAWPHVLQHWPQARLLIVGDGDDEGRLKAVAEQLELTDSVLFAGYRSDLAELFARADIFLRMSVNEGVNLTTIQAMAAGLPTIGFKNPAPKEIISDHINGRLVKLGDAVALGQAISEISGEKELLERLGQTARRRVNQYYSIQNVARFYEYAYEALRDKRDLASAPDMHHTMHRFDEHFSQSNTIHSRSSIDIEDEEAVDARNLDL
jgi:glycosyltransferase involved in cell wall biosynthesis